MTGFSTMRAAKWSYRYIAGTTEIAISISGAFTGNTRMNSSMIVLGPLNSVQIVKSQSASERRMVIFCETEFS